MKNWPLWGRFWPALRTSLNNPLSVIVQQASLLQGELDDDPRGVRAGKVLQAAHTCSRIVKNFLALARQDPPQRVPVSLNDVVHAAVDIMAYGLRADRNRAETGSGRGDAGRGRRSAAARTDRLQSGEQCAVCAGSRQAPRLLTVRTSVDAAGGRVQLRVEDNGGGMPADIRARIFEPFFTTKPTGQGTGLGLSLCHGMVSAHNGTISVISEIDAGTAVVITLPIGLAPAEGAGLAEPAAPPLPALRILVVDDDPDVGSAFSEILSSQGHHVDIAGSGRDAIERIGRENTYAVVVTDMADARSRRPGLVPRDHLAMPQPGEVLPVRHGRYLSPEDPPFSEGDRGRVSGQAVHVRGCRACRAAGRAQAHGGALIAIETAVERWRDADLCRRWIAVRDSDDDADRDRR